MVIPTKRIITLDRLRSSVQQLLLATDWREITVQHVAECAGVSIGTFYNYYDSKDDALADVRSCLSALIKKDLNVLLSTQDEVGNRISLLIKYFVNILNAKPTWASYFYRADSFADRVDGGLAAILEPLILEELMSNKGLLNNATLTAAFIENGLFPILKKYHSSQKQISEKDASHIVTLSLSSFGMSGSALIEAANLICPITPLAPLSQSIFELENTQAGYV